MAAARPVLTVYKLDGSTGGQVKTPEVFTAQIRTDIVRFAHTNMAKNARQAYAVSEKAGMQHSAESWGTGRAVARIPRVSGGGTARSGQAAFGNMCRKGRMFAPTKIFRRWHRKTNVNQKRFAVTSALAASAIPALVMARGHNVGNLKEVPLVVDDAIETITRTKEAIAALKAVGAYDDVARAAASRKVRTGVSRMRNRTHSVRLGPLVIYNKDQGLVKAFRNLPGVETANVESLNLLQLAPSGTVGRFIVWTQSAITALGEIFGSVERLSTKKTGYHLAHPLMSNPDVTRIINSSEIQTALNAKKAASKKSSVKLNPLTNFAEKVRLNPYALHLRYIALAKQAEAQKLREARLAAQREGKTLPRTPQEAKKRAIRKALAAQRKANFQRISTGAAAVENPGFDKKKFNALKGKLQVGPATTPASDKNAKKAAANAAKRAQIEATSAATAKKIADATTKNAIAVAAHVKKAKAAKKAAPKKK